MQYHFSGSPGSVQGAAPALGADTEEVLTDLAMGGTQVEKGAKRLKMAQPTEAITSVHHKDN